MVININGDLFDAQILNPFKIQVKFPNGNSKELYKDPDHNWVFDINDGDFMLAAILGQKWVEMHLAENKPTG